MLCAGEFVERVVNGEQLVVGGGGGKVQFIQLYALLAAAMAKGALARALSMRMRRMASAAAAKKWARLANFRGFLAHQSEPRLVNQRRRLERLPGGFVRHPLRGEFAQFVVDQREQFVL